MKTRILTLVALLFAVASFAQPRAEYPRPQFERENWINLNGEWSFTLDLANTGAERNYYNSKGFDSKISGSKTRVSSALRIIENGRAEEALLKIRDSARINSQHPEAKQIANQLLMKMKK